MEDSHYAASVQAYFALQSASSADAQYYAADTNPSKIENEVDSIMISGGAYAWVSDWTGFSAFLTVTYIDRKTIFLNCIFLMIIAFIPYPTALLGEYPGLLFPSILYGVNGLI